LESFPQYHRSEGALACLQALSRVANQPDLRTKSTHPESQLQIFSTTNAAKLSQTAATKTESDQHCPRRAGRSVMLPSAPLGQRQESPPSRPIPTQCEPRGGAGEFRQAPGASMGLASRPIPTPYYLHTSSILLHKLGGILCNILTVN
jgi:hypothetical protein